MARPPPDVDARGPYAPAWERFRRLSRTFLAVLALGPAGFLLAAQLAPATWKDGLLTAMSISWMAALVVVGGMCRMTRCPHCGQRFFMRGLFHNDFTRRCLHCGLRRYAEHPDGRDP